MIIYSQNNDDNDNYNENNNNENNDDNYEKNENCSFGFQEKNNNTIGFMSFIMKFIKSMRYSEKCRVVKYKKNILELYPPDNIEGHNSSLSYKENLTDQDVNKFTLQGYKLTKEFFNN